MNENVEKILDLFANQRVLSVLESPTNYIVSVCGQNVDPNETIECLFAVNKKTFKISEFSYFNKPDEYAEACNNVIYKYESDELAHHGVVGMKWGVRRYQKKDGSLTPAGKKRRAKLEAELKQLGGKKNASGKEEAPRKKTASEMTDDELRAHTTRMMLEANYHNAKKNLAIANPQKVSAGKKFMNGLMNDVIAPAAKSAGRAWAEKFMKDKLGLNEGHKKTVDEKLKELDLKVRQKNEPLDDLRREIAILDAQRRLKQEQERE